MKRVLRMHVFTPMHAELDAHVTNVSIFSKVPRAFSPYISQSNLVGENCELRTISIS